VIRAAKIVIEIVTHPLLGKIKIQIEMQIKVTFKIEENLKYHLIANQFWLFQIRHLPLKLKRRLEIG
jgi:hypothetical protein